MGTLTSLDKMQTNHTAIAVGLVNSGLNDEKVAWESPAIVSLKITVVMCHE